MITLQDVIKRLTDVYNKLPESNISKLLKIMTEQMQAEEATLEKVREWRDIDKAQGTTLDKIGQNVGQSRGVATDEVYRILIKSKIARNFSTADIDTIINVLSTALNTDPREIEIKEMWADPIAPEAASISVVKLPLNRINEVGMSPATFSRIVKRTVAAGVGVGVIELTGTFSFGGFVPNLVPFIKENKSVSDQYMLNDQTMVPDEFDAFLELLLGVSHSEGYEYIPEYSPDNGFSNLEESTGGYFGTAFVSNDDALPI